MIDQQKIKQAVRLLLEGMGEDVNREGLIETPASTICSPSMARRTLPTFLTAGS